jgi:hypothetical protein
MAGMEQETGQINQSCELLNIKDQGWPDSGNGVRGPSAVIPSLDLAGDSHE